MINIISILMLICFTIVGNVAFAQKNSTKVITPVNNNLNQAQDIVNGDKNVTNNITIKENYGPINMNENLLPDLLLVDYKDIFEDSFYNITFKVIDKNHTNFNNFKIKIRFNDTVYYSYGTVSGTSCYLVEHSNEYHSITCEFGCKACPYNDGFFIFSAKNKRRFTIEEIICNYPIKE